MTKPTLSFWGTTFVAIASFIAIFLLNTQEGLRLTSDSEGYLALAQHWGQSYWEERHKIWPPLYPALLSLAPEALVGIYAKFLNIVALSLGICCWLQIAKKRLSPAFFAVYMVGLCLSTELHWIAQYIWSESVFFMLWSALAYFIFEKEKPDPYTNKWIIFLGSALALQRHSGLFLLGGSFIGLSMWHSEKKRKPWLAIVAMIPWAMWAVYSQWWIELGYFAERQYGHADIWQPFFQAYQGLGAIAEVILRGLVPSMILPSWAENTLALLLLLAILVVGIAKHKELSDEGRWLICCLATYLGIHGMIGYAYRIDMIRFVAVVWPAGLLLGFMAWNRYSPYWNVWVQRMLLGAWIAYTALRLLHHLLAWNGIGTMTN